MGSEPDVGDGDLSHWGQELLAAIIEAAMEVQAENRAVVTRHDQALISLDDSALVNDTDAAGGRGE